MKPSRRPTSQHHHATIRLWSAVTHEEVKIKVIFSRFQFERLLRMRKDGRDNVTIRVRKL